MLDALWGWPPPVLDPAGPYAERVTVLAWALIGMALVVTAIVIAALWVAVKGPPGLKAKLGGERAVWIGGIAFPGVVLTGLLIWGLTLTASLTQPITGEEMRIRVTGEMWWFRVQYLDEAGEIIINDANELHLPVDVPVVLELRSADVIHSFWIPHLSGKKDMIPGRTTLLRVEASEAGRYGGVCAEYCGGPHALMGFIAVAHEPGEWEQWMAARLDREEADLPLPGRPAPELEPSDLAPPDLALPPPRTAPLPAIYTDADLAGEDALDGFLEADLARGRELFMGSGCGACHRVAGTEADGLTGPDLTYVGSRLSLGAGILPNHRGTLMAWIADSQSIKPGNRMPTYDRLSAAQLNDIAAWLEQQR